MRTVGGTLVSRILGLSPWGGPLAAYLELTAGTEAPRNPSMGRGKVLESSVLSLWAQRDGVLLLPWSTTVRPESMPHAHATLDGLAVASLEDGPLVLAEAKTLALEQMGPDWGWDGSDKVPHHYHLQALWYAGVCRAAGLHLADEVALPVLLGPEAELVWAARLVERMGRELAPEDLEGSGLQLRVCRLPWDETLFRRVDERVRDWLERHVAKGEPPEPSEGDVLLERDRHAVARGFRADRGAVWEWEKVPPVAQATVLELLEASRQRKEWEGREDEARARVQLLMKGVEEIRGCPGGARVQWKETSAGSRRFTVREPKR